MANKAKNNNNISDVYKFPIIVVNLYYYPICKYNFDDNLLR